MRYLLQLLIPALVVIGLVLLVLRNSRSRSNNETTNTDPNDTSGDGEKGTFILILMIGAVVAIGIVFAIFGEASP